MSGAAIVRAANNEDLPAILGMLSRLAAAHQGHDPARFVVAPDIAAVYRAWLEPAREGAGVLALVAELQGPDGSDVTVVGYMIAESIEGEPRYWASGCVYVHDLFVEPEARRNGVGEAMLSRAKAWAREIGVGQVRALVGGWNTGGREFFGREGFRVGAVEMGWDAG